MKPLRQAVGDYLALRRNLGFKLKDHEHCLRELLFFLKKKRSSRLTTRLALQFATEHKHQQPAQWAARLRVVRGFARYRRGQDPHTEIPPLGLLPYRSQRAKPYVYSEQEIRELLKAAQNLHSTATLNPCTYHYLFGLLATTGMRISEALNLQRKDVDLTEGVLTINGAKFGKSRLVPLHSSTVKALSVFEAPGSFLRPENRFLFFRLQPWHAFGRRTCSSNVLLPITSDRVACRLRQPWSTAPRFSSPICSPNTTKLVSAG